jgi:geranylgeranyl pyrophosphate synthase
LTRRPTKQQAASGEGIAKRPFSAARTRTYLQLMQRAEEMFRPAELRRLIGPCLGDLPGVGEARPASEKLHPIATTAAIALDFLGRGGKHLRPFITLATFDAIAGSDAPPADSPPHRAPLPDAAYRAALSIEVFHKASLVHDDIEDDDTYRYGDPTLHRSHGVPTAINVGDYLIGLGYRLVSQESATLGAEVAADILDRFAEAHMRLCEGQGAELAWRDAREKDLTPGDALRIYALKTAPAFEAALYAGLRLAGPVDSYREPIRQFAKNVGIAFQILNDLKDWYDDRDNKLKIGEDALHQRPTLLWALATSTLTGRDRRQLMEGTTQGEDRAAAVARVRALYQKARVFETADQLVNSHQRQAEEIAATVVPDSLRYLLSYLIDTILERPSGELQRVVPATLQSGLPVVAQAR